MSVVVLHLCSTYLPASFCADNKKIMNITILLLIPHLAEA